MCINEMGITVLRYRDDDVINNIEGVMEFRHDRQAPGFLLNPSYAARHHFHLRQCSLFF